jgi:hypothetical protein
MFVFRKIAEKQGFGGGFMTVGKSRPRSMWDRIPKWRSLTSPA